MIICPLAKVLRRGPSGTFAAPRALPADWINNAFLDWDGHARVLWPERRLELDVTADPPLSTYILYSPSAKADFFCFEPVTHPVDAHNLPGGPAANGLTILAQQETISKTCSKSPRLARLDSGTPTSAAPVRRAAAVVIGQPESFGSSPDPARRLQVRPVCCPLRAAISSNSIVAAGLSASRIRTHSNTARCAERARDWAGRVVGG